MKSAVRKKKPQEKPNKRKEKNHPSERESSPKDLQQIRAARKWTGYSLIFVETGQPKA